MYTSTVHCTTWTITVYFIHQFLEAKPCARSTSEEQQNVIQYPAWFNKAGRSTLHLIVTTDLGMDGD